MINPVKALTLAATALITALILAAVYFVARTPQDVVDGPPVQAPAPSATGTVVYTVPGDASASRIGDDLEALGIVRSGRQFALLVRLMGLQGRLTAGEHEFEKGRSTLAAIEVVTSQEIVPTLRVTLPEGLRFEEMADLVDASGIATRREFLDAVAAARLPAELGDTGRPEGQSLQGYLFPDTYIVPVGTTASELVQLMLRTFVRRFTPELRASVQARGLTIHQAVTLASIIEREAQVAAERPLMAAVFYNRIAAGDLLGADPTVQFAVTIADATSIARFGYWKKTLTKEDLDVNSQYNTRKFAGIPPGPITNPGLASLEAVAKPAVSNAYYFVADARANDGSHVFAETLEQHEANQARVGGQ